MYANNADHEGEIQAIYSNVFLYLMFSCNRHGDVLDREVAFLIEKVFL